MDRTRGRTSKALALAAALFLGTAGAAFAATLALNARGLGTGSVTTDCQSSAVTTSWVVEYDPATPGYQITGVTLDGLTAGCLDRSVTVVVADASGAQVATGTGTTPNSGSSATVDFGTPFVLGSPWLSQATVMVYA